jgi:hypothetical protein
LFTGIIDGERWTFNPFESMRQLPNNKRRRTASLIRHCFLFLSLALPAALLGQTYSINSSPLSGTGGTVTNSLFTIRGSIGQFDATIQPLTGNGFSSTGGYWTFPDIFAPGPPDYLQVSMGSTNMQAGQTVAVPITFSSSVGVTSLALNLQWPSNYFNIPQITALDPIIASVSIQIDDTTLAIVIQVLPGQVLQDTQPIAQLSFSETSNEFHSAFVALPITSVAANKPAGSPYTNYFIQSATIAVINDGPLLVATVSAEQGRSLNLYGWPGTNYQLQYSTNLALPDSWLPVSNYVQSNGVVSVIVDSTNADIFYRVKQP